MRAPAPHCDRDERKHAKRHKRGNKFGRKRCTGAKCQPAAAIPACEARVVDSALRDHGEAFRAMSEYEKAVELRPTHFAALCSLAELYSEKGFRRKSVEALERALLSAPDGKTREGIRTRLLRLL